MSSAPRCRRACSSRRTCPHRSNWKYWQVSLVTWYRTLETVFVLEEERQDAVVHAVRIAFDQRERQGSAGLPAVALLAPRSAGADREVPVGAACELHARGRPARDGCRSAPAAPRTVGRCLRALDRCVAVRVLHRRESARCGDPVQGEGAFEAVAWRRRRGRQGECIVGDGRRRRGARGELGGGEHRAVTAPEPVRGSPGTARSPPLRGVELDAGAAPRAVKRGCREGSAQEEGEGTTHGISFDPFSMGERQCERARADRSTTCSAPPRCSRGIAGVARAWSAGRAVRTELDRLRIELGVERAQLVQAGGDVRARVVQLVPHAEKGDDQLAARRRDRHGDEVVVGIVGEHADAATCRGECLGEHGGGGLD